MGRALLALQCLQVYEVEKDAWTQQKWEHYSAFKPTDFTKHAFVMLEDRLVVPHNTIGITAPLCWRLLNMQKGIFNDDRWVVMDLEFLDHEDNVLSSRAHYAGRGVEAENQMRDAEPSDAFDGSERTFWSSDYGVESGEGGDWIGIGELQGSPVSRIRIRQDPQHASTALKLQYTDDPECWTRDPRETNQNWITEAEFSNIQRSDDWVELSVTGALAELDTSRDHRGCEAQCRDMPAEECFVWTYNEMAGFCVYTPLRLLSPKIFEIMGTVYDGFSHRVEFGSHQRGLVSGVRQSVLRQSCARVPTRFQSGRTIAQLLHAHFHG